MVHKIKKENLLKKISMNKKVCVMGIGNFDRADDYSGIAVIENLETKKFAENMELPNGEKAALIRQHREDVLKEAQRIEGVLETLEQ